MLYSFAAIAIAIAFTFALNAVAQTDSSAPTPASPSSTIQPARAPSASPPGPAASTSAPSVEQPVVPGSEDVDSLLQKATDLYRQKDYDGVVKNLDRIKVLNPELAGLWGMYGALATVRGQPFEAIDDFKKEIKLHPDSIDAYSLLAALQMTHGLNKDAIITLRAWVAADPSNPQAAGTLMDLLLKNGDAASAMAAGESALVRLPETARKDWSFQFTLGQVQIAAGEKDKGTATLVALLNSSQDPAKLNDAAYLLADSSLDLPQAEASIRAALDKLSKESSSWTLDDSPEIARAKSRLIFGAWDTLGWTLFREGNFAEAEGYLRAAWIGTQDPEVGKHLDALASAGHRKPQFDRDFVGVLRSFFVFAHAQNGKPQLSNPNDPNSLSLGPANFRDGVAEYHLLLRNDEVVDLKPTGDKTIPWDRDIVANAKLTGFFPPGSRITLVRDAYLNCHSGVCDLILEP